MPCYPPDKGGTARELRQPGKDGCNTWGSCERSLASSVAETSVPLGTAPGTSITPKTPPSSVYLQDSKEELICLSYTSGEGDGLGEIRPSPKLSPENLRTCKTGLIHLDRP